MHDGTAELIAVLLHDVCVFARVAVCTDFEINLISNQMPPRHEWNFYQTFCVIEYSVPFSDPLSDHLWFFCMVRRGVFRCKHEPRDVRGCPSHLKVQCVLS